MNLFQKKKLTVLSLILLPLFLGLRSQALHADPFDFEGESAREMVEDARDNVDDDDALSDNNDTEQNEILGAEGSDYRSETGSRMADLPDNAQLVTVAGQEYYTADGVYYQLCSEDMADTYCIVPSPVDGTTTAADKV